MIRSFSPFFAAISLAFGAGCSLGQGTGEVRTDGLFAHDCWGASEGMVKGAPYNLAPDFFAAIPYRSTLQIRVQRGNDLTEVSDGLNVLIDDVDKIRAKLPPPPASGVKGGSTLSCPLPADAGADLDDCPEGSIGFPVALPAGVTPPGSPAVPPPDLLADPPLVHADLYLHHSCHNQNTVLYAVAGKMCFAALFNGEPDESSANEKLTYASLFKLQVGDLRDVPLGMYPRDIPIERQSTVRGCFRFYFERGQPGQPFP